MPTSNDELSPEAHGVTIEEATTVTAELVTAWAKLMGQLSRSAAAPTAEWLNELINSDSVLFVARVDGQIVGSLTLVLTRIPVGLKAWIEDVVVDEGFRGRRIGEYLSSAAILRAEQAGARSINLTSSPSREAANRLYHRIGFRLRDTNVYHYVKESK